MKKKNVARSGTREQKGSKYKEQDEKISEQDNPQRWNCLRMR